MPLERFLNLSDFPNSIYIQKWGRNDDVSSGDDIWNGIAPYTGFPASSDFISFTSSNANDTVNGTGCQVLRLFYYDENRNIFNKDGSFIYRDFETNGGTVNTDLVTDRIWRCQCVRAGSLRKMADDITVFQTNTPANIFAVIPNEYSQTNITNFTIPNGWNGYLKNFLVTLNDNTSNRAEMGIRTIIPGSNTNRITNPFTAKTEYPVSFVLEKGLFIESGTDFVFHCIDIANANGSISVQYELELERIV